MKVLGYSKYSGEFEGRKYSGYFVHCSFPRNNNEEGVGEKVKQIKVKSTSPAYNNIPMLAPGDEITPFYDERGNCVELRID